MRMGHLIHHPQQNQNHLKNPKNILSSITTSSLQKAMAFIGSGGTCGNAFIQNGRYTLKNPKSRLSNPLPNRKKSLSRFPVTDVAVVGHPVAQSLLYSPPRVLTLI